MKSKSIEDKAKEPQAYKNPIEDQRAEALRHYQEASSAIHHWSGFVEAAIKSYNPEGAAGNSNQPVPVIIKCPACDFVQAAIVELTIPFGTYIHHCVKCEYVIMESEWNEIKPFFLNPESLPQPTPESGNTNRWVKANRITLCGSTKFKNEFEWMNKQLTLEGNIVYSVSFFGHADKIPLTVEQKVLLDNIHKQKIDNSDGIFVIDVDGYIGSSTKSEIEHAKKTGKFIKYLSESPYIIPSSPNQLEELRNRVKELEEELAQERKISNHLNKH